MNTITKCHGSSTYGTYYSLGTRVVGTYLLVDDLPTFRLLYLLMLLVRTLDVACEVGTSTRRAIRCSPTLRPSQLTCSSYLFRTALTYESLDNSPRKTRHIMQEYDAATQPLVDLENSPIPGQLGTAVMDLNGKMVRGGDQLSSENASILFRMLVEVGMLEEEGFRRLTVSFPLIRYVAARDSNHVYIVQTRKS